MKVERSKKMAKKGWPQKKNNKNKKENFWFSIWNSKVSIPKKKKKDSENFENETERMALGYW